MSYHKMKLIDEMQIFLVFHGELHRNSQKFSSMSWKIIFKMIQVYCLLNQIINAEVEFFNVKASFDNK